MRLSYQAGEKHGESVHRGSCSAMATKSSIVSTSPRACGSTPARSSAEDAAAEPPNSPDRAPAQHLAALREGRVDHG
jgi:hypothetical protein